jgi:hypothetical protein
MKISDFQKRIPMYYRSRHCIYLIGKIGRGKSTVIEGATKQLEAANPGKKFGVVVISGPLLNPPDAVGYLMPRQVEEHLESMFTQPFWFRTHDGKHINDFDAVIVFIDEADKMDSDVKKIMGEMALSRRLGPHRLRPDDVVWMAGNYQKEGGGSTKEFNHLINRRHEIHLNDDIESVVDYYQKAKVHPLYVAFAASNPEVVFEEPPKVQGPWCTPRSLHMCADFHAMFATKDDELPFDDMIMEDIEAKIGSSAGSHLNATIQLQRELPKIADIIANPMKVKVPTAPDAQMLVCYSLAARSDENNIDPFIQYVERMPAEFTITFGKAAITREPDLINSNAFGKWTARNAALVMAIS